MMNSILVVDDNPNLQTLLSKTLQGEGYSVTSCTNGVIALDLIAKHSYDLVILDIKLPGLGGMDVLKRSRQIDPDLVVIMITAFGDIRNSVEAMKLGALNYLTKPFNLDEMILNIRQGIETRSLKREVSSLRQLLQEKQEAEIVTGDSPAIRRVIQKAELIARTDFSVIIQGKSGTGKEVIARLIHKLSTRSNQPFQAIDCGAIPEDLFESEMFGHEKGAFTGAHTARKGKFELANHGTLFLDEITNLSDAAQAKLLRAIQDKEIQKVGGNRSHKLDIRLLAATNCDLIEKVNCHHFREDLFYRLNEYQIQMPLLQERSDDIPVLAYEFLQEANRELNRNIGDFSPEAMLLLLNYSWPGNVRQLRQIVKKAALLSPGNRIEAEAVKLPADHAAPIDHPGKTMDFHPDKLADYLQMILKDGLTLKQVAGRLSICLEKAIIRGILREVNDNKTEAARLLGIDRSTLYLKLKQPGDQA